MGIRKCAVGATVLFVGAGWTLVASGAVSNGVRTHFEDSLPGYLSVGENCRVEPGDLPTWEQLRQCMPPAANAAERTRILQTLPANGELAALSREQGEKIVALRPILAAHGRENVYEIKIVNLFPARIGLYARTVLILSAPALDLLNDRELSALAAHEMGHEYFQEEYAEAKSRGDRPRLRQVEVLCDGFAVATLLHLGLDPDELARALIKVTHYNRERFGMAANEDEYPPLNERILQIQQWTKQLKRGSQTQFRQIARAMPE